MYISHIVREEESGQSAQAVLKNTLHFSQVLLRKLKRYQALHVNQEFVLHKTKVFTGDIIEVSFEEEGEYIGPLENPLSISILYEDDWLALVSKPPALPSHPRFPGDSGLSTSFGENHLHLINRLDLDTSGLTILGKNPYAHDLMSRSPISKIYLGLVHGVVEDNGLIHAPIARKEGSIIERKVSDEGKEAITHFQVLQIWPKQELSLLAFRLETGRTHQIRVHSQYIGHPLVGDTLYGAGQYIGNNAHFSPVLAKAHDAQLQRQFLHAYQNVFVHPITKEKIDIKAELYEDLSSFLDAIKEKEQAIEAKGSIDALLDLEMKARNIQNNNAVF